MKALTRTKNARLFQNPYLLFAPFLIIYIIIVILYHSDKNVGDESRYILFAQNLLKGYYSPPSPDIDLTNGPGYPIVLMPFIGFKFPLICVTLMNALFFYMSIILLFKSLQKVVKFRMALIISLFWACYYNSYEYFPLILSETLTLFLISLLIFSLITAFDPSDFKKARYYLLISGFTLGYIVLTKYIFGYVLLFMLISTGILWIINRNTYNYRKGLSIMLIAFAINIPYLAYTYHLTGKMFYWGSSGGDSLYWMSTPFEGEYGDWHSLNELDKESCLTGDNLAFNRNPLKSNHQKVYEEVSKYKGVEKDDAFKRIAINNIKTYPFKYLQNCLSNTGRILFNYPYSYTLQKPGTLLRIPHNGIIVVLLLFCLIPSIANWRKIAYSVRIMIFISLLYLGGSVLATAEIRMFTIIVPFLLIWIALIIDKTVKINVKWIEKTE